MRVFSLVVLAAALALLAGCSSSGGGPTPVGVATIVSLSPSAGQSLGPGGTLTITATVTSGSSNTGVTWSLSGPGTLSSKTANPVTYTAPSSASSNINVVVTATAAASSSATAYLPLIIVPSVTGSNVVPLAVNSGPAQNSSNIAFVSITICEPGTTTCQTVDDIQVDTGSAGLRVLQSAIPSLSLSSLTDTSGNTINNCVSFLDGSYLWGPVQQADLRINGEVAGGALIQTISSGSPTIPSACSNGGTVLENTPTLLGANGILGVGLEPTDCIVAGQDFCDGSVSSTIPAIYFSCPSSGCASNASPVVETATNQVVNPIVLFATDNNGSAIQFAPVSGAAATATGSLTFGIGTQSNNALGSATVFTLDSSDNFETIFQGQSLIASFIDSGSNSLSFPSTLTVCPGNNSSFYCPTGLTSLSAENVAFDLTTGAFDGTPNTVPFDIDNASTLFATNGGNDFAFSTLGGPQGTYNTCTSTGSGSCSFDWGLPFFYGRTVFTAIDGQAVSVATAPWFAY